MSKKKCVWVYIQDKRVNKYLIGERKIIKKKDDKSLSYFFNAASRNESISSDFFFS